MNTTIIIWKLYVQTPVQITIEENAFSDNHFQNITYLTLVGNITHLNKKCFAGLHLLATLEIDGGLLQYVAGGILNDVQNLVVLQIENGISDDHLNHFLQNITLHSLLELHIGYNNFHNLKSENFRGLTNLVTLDAQFSNIMSIESTILESSAKRIQKVIFSNNKLETLPVGIFNITSPRSSFEVYLKDNKLKTLPKGIFDMAINNNVTVKVYLENNNWHCDCDLAWLQSYIVDGKICVGNQSKCESPEINKNKSFEEADFSDCNTTTVPSASSTTATEAITSTTTETVTSETTALSTLETTVDFATSTTDTTAESSPPTTEYMTNNTITASTELTADTTTSSTTDTTTSSTELSTDTTTSSTGDSDNITAPSTEVTTDTTTSSTENTDNTTTSSTELSTDTTTSSTQDDSTTTSSTGVTTDITTSSTEDTDSTTKSLTEVTTDTTTSSTEDTDNITASSTAVITDTTTSSKEEEYVDVVCHCPACSKNYIPISTETNSEASLFTTHGITDFEIVEDDQLNQITVTIKAHNEHVLIWMTRSQNNYIDCKYDHCHAEKERSSHSLTASFSSDPNTAYTICAAGKISENKVTICTLNCRPYTTLPSPAYRAWLLNKDTGIILLIFCIALLVSVITGAATIYYVLLHKPELINGNKRVIVVKCHTNQVIMIMPKGYCENERRCSSLTSYSTTSLVRPVM